MNITQTSKWRINLEHLIRIGTENKYMVARKETAAAAIKGLNVVFNDKEIKQIISKANQCLKNKFYEL